MQGRKPLTAKLGVGFYHGSRTDRPRLLVYPQQSIPNQLTSTYIGIPLLWPRWPAQRICISHAKDKAWKLHLTDGSLKNSKSAVLWHTVWEWETSSVLEGSFLWAAWAHHYHISGDNFVSTPIIYQVTILCQPLSGDSHLSTPIR